MTFGGTLTIDGRGVSVTHATSELFVGCLDVHFESDNQGGSIDFIPFVHALDYPTLSKRTVSIADCPNAEYENSLLKPSFSIEQHHHSIQSLHVEDVLFNPLENSLSLKVHLAARDEETRKEICVQGHLVTECQDINVVKLLLSSRPIWIHYANQYLPLLQIPTIPANATRPEVAAIFAFPYIEGGGALTPGPSIPAWVLYKLPNCFINISFDAGVVHHVTLTPTEEWMDHHHLGALKQLYCLPPQLIPVG